MTSIPDESPSITLIETIAGQIGCAVEVITCQSASGDESNPACKPGTETEFVRDTIALAEADPATSEWINSDQTQAIVRLSDSELLHWHTRANQAALSVRLTQTILDRDRLQQTVDDQTFEIDSLTTQVISDFEELALLRSLADSMSLLTDIETPADIAERFIHPLIDGLGVRALAAILLPESHSIQEPSQDQVVIWTGSEMLDDPAVHELVSQHHHAAQLQPVVINHLSLPSLLSDEPIEELIAIECRSESRLHGWLIAFNRLDDGNSDVAWAQHGFTTVQAALMQTATSQLAAQLQNARLFRQKEDLFTDVVRALVNAVEARDPYTCGHSERVASFARCLSSLIGQPAAEVERIYLTGLLHDVGKIAIPDGVLQKPGRLDDQERAIIETHTDAGWRILHQLDALKSVLPGVLYHHEHFNGRGYPDGLEGEAIPLEGRILAVCDAFDAMTSDRPYRDGMPVDKAVEILRGGSGSYWDPALVTAFVDNIDAIDAIRLSHEPRQVPVREKPPVTPRTDPEMPVQVERRRQSVPPKR